MVDSGEESEPRLPSDSDSEKPRKEAVKEPSPKAESGPSSDDDSDAGTKLPSVEKAFEMVDKKGLTFAKFGDGVWGTRPKVSPDAKARTGAAIEAAASGPGQLFGIAPRPEDGNMQLEAPQARERSRSPQKMPIKKPEYASAKERTKQKRLKGQSGEDHSGRQWKPEEWMKMRQQFD